MMKLWEKTLAAPESTIEQAIAIIDSGAQRIAMIVDHDRRLLGTLTDGDVRRALLKHTPSNAPARGIMCTSPKTAGVSWERDRVLSVMEANALLQLPIVNAEGEVVGLHTLHGLIGSNRRIDNAVFLMAGGFGKRLHPLTNHCPKPLLKIGGKPILELILEGLIDAGFHRFFISTHYLPEMVQNYFGDGGRWGVTIKYTHEEEPLGTGGALGLLPHAEINEPMLMMNGDLLTSLNYSEFIGFHDKHNGIATMGVRVYEHQVPYGVIESDGPRVRSMVEKPIQKFFVNAGVYILEPELIKSVKPGTTIDMPNLLEEWIEAGRDVTTFPVHEYWLDIGRMEDFERAQIEVESLFK